MILLTIHITHAHYHKHTGQNTRKRKVTLRRCAGCLKQNCGNAVRLDMPKFDGPGKKKKRCLQRTCEAQKNKRFLLVLFKRIWTHYFHQDG